MKKNKKNAPTIKKQRIAIEMASSMNLNILI